MNNRIGKLYQHNYGNSLPLRSGAEWRAKPVAWVEPYMPFLILEDIKINDHQWIKILVGNKIGFMRIEPRFVEKFTFE